MLFTAALDAYLDHLDGRAYSPNTIRRLRIVLGGFARFCDPMTAAEGDVEAWLATRKLCARTRCTYLQYLGGFYRFGLRRRYVAADPTVDIERPRLGHSLPRPIPDAALAAALAGADARMRVMLCLAAYQGMRCQEIAGCCAEHLLGGPPPMLLVAEGKGRRERMVPLAEATEAALAAWPHPERGPLFRRRGCACGCAICPQTVTIQISRHMHGLGIPHTAHTLRHWFGTQVYRQTLDIRATQELLGHASLVTTQIYTQYSPTAGAAVVRALSVTHAA